MTLLALKYRRNTPPPPNPRYLSARSVIEYFERQWDVVRRMNNKVQEVSLAVLTLQFRQSLVPTATTYVLGRGRRRHGDARA